MQPNIDLHQRSRCRLGPRGVQPITIDDIDVWQRWL
jgi:hypothetical protein